MTSVFLLLERVYIERTPFYTLDKSGSYYISIFTVLLLSICVLN